MRVHRTDSEWVDGAMFGLVLGTDPEVFLLLEERRVKDKTTWQYGLARMNNDSRAVVYNEREVWQVQRVDVQERLRDTYLLTGVPESL
jgi:hypothetical protein